MKLEVIEIELKEENLSEDERRAASEMQDIFHGWAIKSEAENN